jgi:hypothetical protein
MGFVLWFCFWEVGFMRSNIVFELHNTGKLTKESVMEKLDTTGCLLVEIITLPPPPPPPLPLLHEIILFKHLTAFCDVTHSNFK